MRHDRDDVLRLLEERGADAATLRKAEAVLPKKIDAEDHKYLLKRFGVSQSDLQSLAGVDEQEAPSHRRSSLQGDMTESASTGDGYGDGTGDLE